jgi:hypothetical protein
MLINTDKSRVPLPVSAALGLTLSFLAVFIYIEGIQPWVLTVYRYGGDLFASGQDPYAGSLIFGPSGQFKYSPFFAILGRGLSAVGSGPSILIWLAASVAAFVFSLRRWVDQSALRKPWFLIVMFAAFVDLYVSMSVNQANALITAMTLWALADYRDRKYLSAGLMLMLATNLKVYPVIFLLALALEGNRRFLLGAFASGFAAFLVPAVFAGWSHNLAMHMTWVHLVVNETGAAGILDLQSALERVGLKHLGHSLKVLILVMSLPLFLAYRLVSRTSDMRPWIAFGCAMLLLLSPKTEVYTYVLLSPSYVLLYLWFAESGNRTARMVGGIATVFLGVLIASCRFTIYEWFMAEHPLQVLRIIGAFGFWVISGVIIAKILKAAFEARFGFLSNNLIRKSKQSPLV